MKRERECKACDGTGSYLPVDNDTFYNCPACLGTGRVVDLIPAADAVADAQTLVWESLHWALGQDSAAAIRSTQGTGACLLDELEIGITVNGDLPVLLAQDAARAAFRAVPGLRD